MHSHIPQVGNPCQHRRHLRGRQAGFCALAGDIYLQQHVQPPPHRLGVTVEGVEQFAGIHRVDPIEQVGRDKRLVALQVAHQVPFQPSGALRDLGGGFLHAVLAEESLAGSGGFADGLRPKGFRYRQQADIRCRPSRRGASRRHAGTDVLQIVGDGTHSPYFSHRRGFDARPRRHTAAHRWECPWRQNAACGPGSSPQSPAGALCSPDSWISPA